MSVKKSSKGKLIDITIAPNHGNEWSEEKTAEITALTKFQHSRRSPERIRRNAMSAVRYGMEEYVRDEDVTVDEISTIEDFVKAFLKVLGLKKGEFAKHIDVDDSNLNKYYKGDRRFNTVLALKFGHFFHTPADLWLKVQLKNELLELQKEKEADGKYAKYDYEKALQMV